MVIIYSEAAFKISIFGAGGVGKTTLTNRYLTGIFDIDTRLTMGASISVKFVTIENKRVSLQIWDFGGEKEFRFLLPVYAQGSSAGILMFDITRYETFKNLKDWINSFKEGLSIDSQQIPLILVAGKSDLSENRAINAQDAMDMAKKLNCTKYLETSAKTGENIEQLFKDLTLLLMKRADLL